MKCPHCDRSLFIPDAVYLNAEYYGGKVSTINCRKCAKLVDVASNVSVKVTVVGASSKKQSDW